MKAVELVPVLSVSVFRPGKNVLMSEGGKVNIEFLGRQLQLGETC